MEQMYLFTPKQKAIFHKVAGDSFLKSHFYFTGGTALSYFYFHHRYSEDLDFFSETPFSLEKISSIVSLWAQEYNFSFDAQWRDVVYIFTFKFKNGEMLKVDFGHYPYKRIEKGVEFKGVAIDSLLDIAVNKLTAVNQRSQVRDFVDLYYFLKKFTIWDLIEGARIKFRMELEHWILASDLAYGVEKFDSLPRMIKPLTLKELRIFYRNLAKELGKKAVK